MKLVTRIALLFTAAATAEVVVSRVVDDFPWSNPFGEHETPPGFEATCTATRTFTARQHLLSELQNEEPLGLQPWANALKYFFGGRPFPGSWDGVDEHGPKRDVVLMNFTDMPEAVKRWSEVQRRDKESDGMWLFGVYHKNKPGIKIKGTATPRPRPTASVVAGGGDDDAGEGVDAEAARLPPDEDLVVMFAAGAVYHTLPLWVAEGSGCEAELADLERYGPVLKDGGVTGWVVDRTVPDLDSNSREIKFTVKAQVLKETEAGKKARVAREKEEAEASAAALAASRSAEAAEAAATDAKDEL
ncbi:hypothetical protein PpBr36_03621 [Pyricularia pennisetigena]|uniref:hypothetical protein n=1 Tax=Pyricularia pennisetigena TaxID=1578925 RepID=UPI0011533984|nr:hypothetical protein PpBr36_03621 [Pyricularia pennisetigena]TLS31348.1 hypothetical protein PpBr36_03621 [Pyricularia pennisetigena]